MLQTVFEGHNAHSKDLALDGRIEGGRLYITTKGLIDTYNSPLFLQTTAKAMSLNLAKTVVFELQGLDYVSSTGIGSFLQVAKEAEKGGLGLFLVGTSQKVLDVFKLLGFSQFLNFVESEADIEKSKAPNSPFPASFACPHCAERLRATKAGKFRCPYCKNVVSVGEDGNAAK